MFAGRTARWPRPTRPIADFDFAFPPRPAPRARGVPGETGLTGKFTLPVFLETSMNRAASAALRRIPRLRIARHASTMVAFAGAYAPLVAHAADDGDSVWIAWTILAGVGLLVAGILIRAGIGSSTPPGWLAFLARRRDEGRPTRWTEWSDD